jgi:hypothetical protein
MVGGELTYRFMEVGETMIDGNVVTKANSLTDVNSIGFFSEELNAQAFETNAKLFEKQAVKQLEGAQDIRQKNRAALQKRLEKAREEAAAAEAAKLKANGGTPAGKEPLALDEKKGG